VLSARQRREREAIDEGISELSRLFQDIADISSCIQDQPAREKIKIAAVIGIEKAKHLKTS
jgi:hypothetical protein